MYTIPLEQSTISRCDDSVVLDNGTTEQSAAMKKNEEQRRREENSALSRRNCVQSPCNDHKDKDRSDNRVKLCSVMSKVS
jgi:hypothetical protein